MSENQAADVRVEDLISELLHAPKNLLNVDDDDDKSGGSGG